MSMKKKILFVMPHLKTGGITTAFINLMNELKDDKKLEIDLLLFDKDDAGELPESINILPVSKGLRLLATSQKTIEKESKLLGLVRLILGGISKFFANYLAYKLVFLFEKKLTGYDAAISFSQSGVLHSLYGGMNEFIISKVEAKMKITFLHCDYKLIGLDTPYSKKIYSKFDKIAAVCKGAEDVFLDCVPTLKGKTCVVHNCHDFKKMASLAREDEYIYKKDRINIITVARIVNQKAYVRAVNVFKRLKEDGFSFYWHIIGGGEKYDEREIENLIEEYNLSDSVIMHYDQPNPYKFYSGADMFLLASYHEAAPMVFAETLHFNLPVVSTNTIPAQEFVIEKNLGIVCDNNEDAIYNAVKTVLEDSEILNRIRTQEKPEATNAQALEEFYKVIEGE